MTYTDPEDDRFDEWDSKAIRRHYRLRRYGCAAVLLAFAVISLAIVVVAALARGGRL